jgi:signal transduction histidine kinase
MPQIVRRIVRRSLLVQLVSVYLLFVTLVLVTGVAVNAAVEQNLRDEVEASDQALAKEIALDTSSKLVSVEASLMTLGTLARQAGTRDAMLDMFHAFMVARSDVEHVYWLDPLGQIVMSVKSPTSAPDNLRDNLFSPVSVIEQAWPADGPVFEEGIEQNTNVMIIAFAVHDDASGRIVGFVVIRLSLDQLSTPLVAVVQTQKRQSPNLNISIINDQGVVVASSKSDRILQTMAPELPGADQALQGNNQSRLGTAPDDKHKADYLFSSVPVPVSLTAEARSGWAVVVERPTQYALAVVDQLHVWLLMAALIFALGFVVFWLMLLRRVIQPLHALALQHRTLPTRQQSVPAFALTLRRREDEVGGLARSLERLERDVQAQLGELQTLLETSNAVVDSLDPKEVGRTIIREVRRLVDAQAAAVLVPDEAEVLRVLVSEGHDDAYAAAVQVPQGDVSLPAARALHDKRPVQMIAGGTNGAGAFPPVSYDEGFRAVLAIPIISRHVGGVVLLVHRTEPQPFSKNEINLLLTFANYATLAWEHAVLYERSDERLREVAAENERLYRLTSAEKQRLAAIMASMSDGLVLTGADGRVLFANPGAAALTRMSPDNLMGGTIASIHQALRAVMDDPEIYDRALARAEAGDRPNWLVELGEGSGHRAIALHLFDVRAEAGQTIGRGLLLRDVTREREVDEFKTTLLAAVGHELRTPLTAIKGHASTLLQEDVTWSPAEQRHSLRTISAEVDRLAGLVRDLLDLSRQQAGALPLHREPTPLRDLFAGALARLSQPAPGLVVDLPTELPLVDVDRARLEVALRNLLANAMAYGGETIGMVARAHGEMVEVAVSDDGPGIEPGELPHLFERFYRAHRGVQRRSQGTGLGLAICKAFIEAHGGAITAESGRRGTTIRFTLPIAAGEQPVDAPERVHAHSTMD